MLEKNDSSQAALNLAQAQQVIVGLEREIDEVNARLIKAEGGKSYFISHALNELNNPLAAIIGLTEQVMTMQQPAWPHVQQSLLWVRDEGVYLEFQLKNLFMAGELEAGVAKLNRARVDVHALMNAVTTRYLELAQRKGVTILSNDGHALLSTAGSVLHAYTDGAALSLIYANLLDNAIKWSPSGGCIQIALNLHATQLELEVQDDGPGVNASEQALVFDRFWQSDSTTTKSYRGLGLGLSVSANSAQLLGGHLEILRSDAGARFALTLPTLTQDQLIDAPDENVFFFDGDGEVADATY